ncbi:hypothetical protein [Vibrio neptunius]|uniref:hypothetical protein n=1 Tax=Vibrio neptunius TaxID=170651 RepID=UPI001C5CB046|nr:hypothetical protein [Vibrio neptunius]QXX06785.1 oligosaccharide flippase family protein [Vibrio neptunius]
MNIKKAFFWTGLQTAIKVLSGIAINKVIAVYLGPSGLALIGQFQNSTGLLCSIANGSIQTGVVSNIAKSKNEREHLAVRSNAVLIMAVLSIVVSVILVIFHGYFSKVLFLSDGYSKHLFLLAFSMIFYSFNIYIISILNGLGRVKEYSFLNIFLNVIIAICVVTLTIFNGISGAILGFITSQIGFFFLFLCFYKGAFNYQFFKVSLVCVDRRQLISLFSYGLTSFLSGFIMAMMLMTVRFVVITHIDQSSAGYWEGLYKIGFYFHMLFALPISIYYLPKFSSTGCANDIKKYILASFKFCILGLLIIGASIFIFRELIVNILFSSEFGVISDLIPIVLISEAFRVMTSIFSTFLYSKQALKAIILNESVWAIIFVVLSYIFVQMFMLKGILYAYFIACVIQFIIISYFSRFRITHLHGERLCS